MDGFESVEALSTGRVGVPTRYSEVEFVVAVGPSRCIRGLKGGPKRQIRGDSVGARALAEFERRLRWASLFWTGPYCSVPIRRRFKKLPVRQRVRDSGVQAAKSKCVHDGEPYHFRLILFLPLVCRTPLLVRPFASLFSPSSAHSWPHLSGARHSPFRD